MRPGPLISTLLAALLPAGQALACLVCIAVPERTLADRVLEDAVVVLAREDPAQPFTYAPVEVLRGAVDEPIPFLVDSTTRRRFAGDPGLALLATRETDGALWERGALIAEADRALIDDVLARERDWAYDPTHPDRFAYFAARHDHADADIRRIALAEISRSPYAMIRTIAPRIPRRDIVKVLRDPVWVEWAPIHILFLGLSADPADHDFVRRSYARASQAGLTTNLGAWATALVEIGGTEAVARLERDYLAGSTRSDTELREITRALSTQAGAGDAALRRRIAAAFRTLAGTRPDIAAVAAQELIAVQDWSLTDIFADLAASDGVSPPERFAINLYLAAAREAGAL